MTPDEAYRRNFAAIDWSVPIVTERPARGRGPRSDFAAPMLIRDDLPDLRGMHDGKVYDSKSSLRRAYRQAGVREIETGEAVSTYDGDRIGKADVADAMQKVAEGYKPHAPNVDVLPGDDE